MPPNPADSDLPHLVAEAMGWELKGAKYELKSWWDADKCIMFAVQWHPDTNWNHMGQVVAWLNGKGWNVHMGSIPNACWAGIVRTASVQPMEVEVEAPTLPVALCRAVVALKERGLI